MNGNWWHQLKKKSIADWVLDETSNPYVHAAVDELEQCLESIGYGHGDSENELRAQKILNFVRATYVPATEEVDISDSAVRVEVFAAPNRRRFTAIATHLPSSTKVTHEASSEAEAKDRAKALLVAEVKAKARALRDAA